MKINLDLQSLRSFIKVAELGSFTLASGALNMTQPAISQQIRRLEELLGTELFIRENKTTLLTLDGEKLLSYAREIVGMNDKVGSMFAASESRTVVTMGMPEHFCDALLPRVIAKVSAHLPDVQLVMRVARSGLISDAVANGTVDLGLVIDEAARVQETPWQDVAVNWYGPEQGEIAPSALGNMVPLVLFRPPCGFRSLAISMLERHGVGWRCAYESEDLMSLRSAVLAGVGLTLLPVISDVRGLKSVSLSQTMPQLPNFSITLRQRPGWNPAFKRQMISLLRDTWTELPTSPLAPN